MSDQSEGASPICPCRIFVCAHHIPECPNYPGPSGATNMPQSEQTWPCTRCGKSHRQLEGCFLGPSGAQDATQDICQPICPGGDKCDGDLPGEWHETDCPCYRENVDGVMKKEWVEGA